MRIKLIARIMAEGVRDVFSLLHATIRKHGHQLQTVRLGNAWVNVDPRGWKTRDDMTIIVALGSGGKAQQFAQTMAIADIQKQLVAAGKINMVGDRELYNTAAELTRIMGHKSAAPFFNDPAAINPPYHMRDDCETTVKEAGDVLWCLFQVDENCHPLAGVEALHESVLETEPTGREMTPR